MVSSKRARSSTDWYRSFVGPLPWVMRNGLTSRYAAKKGSMSTTRSFSSGRPLMASTKIGFFSGRSFTSVLQASRLRPLIRTASEPQMPCPQERRNVSVPSSSHLILCSTSRIRSVG